jgi:hypothetical protein
VLATPNISEAISITFAQMIRLGFCYGKLGNQEGFHAAILIYMLGLDGRLVRLCHHDW